MIPPEVEQHDRKEHQSFFGFQNTTNDKTKTQYERLFNGDDSYDAKTHRDDRAHAKSKVKILLQLYGSLTTLKTHTKTKIKGLTVNYEECQRKVPSLTSSNYGSRKPLEAPERKHVRVATVKSEFYNDSRISLQHK